MQSGTQIARYKMVGIVTCVLLLMVGGVTFWHFGSQSQKPVVRAIRIHETNGWRPVDLSASEAEELSGWIAESIDDAAAEYSIESIRRAVSAMRQMFVSGEIQVMFQAEYSTPNPTQNQPGMLGSSYVGPDGQKLLIIFLAPLAEIFQQLQKSDSPGKAEATFQDITLIVFLHEWYHLTKQNIAAISVGDTEQIFMLERECWHYTCRDVIDVMQQHNHGAVLITDTPNQYSGYSLVYIAWKDRGSRIDSPDFEKVVRLQTAALGQHRITYKPHP